MDEILLYKIAEIIDPGAFMLRERNSTNRPRRAGLALKKAEAILALMEEPVLSPEFGQNKCSKCGIELSSIMNYVCSNLDCPTGLGPVTC